MNVNQALSHVAPYKHICTYIIGKSTPAVITTDPHTKDRTLILCVSFLLSAGKSTASITALLCRLVVRRTGSFKNV